MRLGLVLAPFSPETVPPAELEFVGTETTGVVSSASRRETLKEKIREPARQKIKADEIVLNIFFGILSYCPKVLVFSLKTMLSPATALCNIFDGFPMVRNMLALPFLLSFLRKMAEFW